MSELPALIVAITGLVSAIGAVIIGLKAHSKINAVTTPPEAKP